MQNADRFRAPDVVNRWRTLSLGIGGIGLLVWAFGLYLEPEQALRSWLLGFIFWGGIGLGSIGILMLQYLTGGAWGVVIRRILEAGSRTLPIIILLFIPLAIGVGTRNVYEWTHLPPTDHIMEWRGVYMTTWFWIVRSVIYFFLFGVMVVLLNRWSAEQDTTTDVESSRLVLERLSRFSGPTLVVWCLVVTFAAVDWMLMLDAHWFSTIWGLLFIAGWALSCYCFVVVILANFSSIAPLDTVIGKRHFHDLGKLMLALVMLWTYFNFSQFLIIWAGNIPEETGWWLARMKDGWGWVGAILIFFHFAFPFVVLFQQDFKRHARLIGGLAVFILVMRVVDMFYLIGPSNRILNGITGAPQGALVVSWLDFVGVIAVGGIWLWWFFGQLTKRSIFPEKDPYFEEAIAHGHGH